MEIAKESNRRPFRLLSVPNTAALLALTPQMLQHLVRCKELPVSALLWGTLTSTALGSVMFLLLVVLYVLLRSLH